VFDWPVYCRHRSTPGADDRLVYCVMIEPAIVLSDLAFEWTAGHPVLDVPSFRIERGERVFLHGPSGSGKSSLLGVIGGVLAPRSGTVRLLGTDLPALSPSRRDHFRADHVGFVFQMFNLLPYLSVVDNVTLAARFSARRRQRAGDLRGEARRLLRALGMDRPSLLRRPVTRLSIGQQQRVAAARALFGRPDVLIADEPTSSLDADARESFLALLMQESAAAGTTLLFVSHDRSLGHLFDRCVGLDDINRARPDREAA
jgi:putative ABC transport system ATP-binding protein